MSEQGVDLSQIRGDRKFHMDYLTNAVTQTMKRQLKDWGELSAGANNAGIEEAMTRQKALWDELIANANDKGTIPTADSKVDEFSEACRQTRALCDDLEMMRDQRPDDQ